MSDRGAKQVRLVGRRRLRGAAATGEEEEERVCRERWPAVVECRRPLRARLRKESGQPIPLRRRDLIENTYEGRKSSERVLLLALSVLVVANC